MCPIHLGLRRGTGIAGDRRNRPRAAAEPTAAVLASKVRSRDPGDRLTACRLFPLCGDVAKSHLRRAVNDSDADVAAAAKDALEQLGG